MKKVVPIYVEEYQGTLLAYRSCDHRFIGQGQSVQDLFERLAEDLPPGSETAFVLEKQRGGELIVDRVIKEKSWAE